jgi:hypothetical protein
MPDRDPALLLLAAVPLRPAAALPLGRTLAPFLPFRTLGHFNDPRRTGLLGAGRDPLLRGCAEPTAAYQNQ